MTRQRFQWTLSRLAMPLVALLGAFPLTAHAQGDEGTASELSVAAAASEPLTLRDSIVALVRAQLGTRYKYGGISADRGFDCSGLVRFVLSAVQVAVPRTASQQARIGTAVAKELAELRPGDLLMFGRGGTAVTHVGIYIGDGIYVHASSVAGKVIESRIDRPGSGVTRRWLGVRRILPDAVTTGAIATS